jgi:hypothetical protein
MEFLVDLPATKLQLGDVVTIDYKNYTQNEVPVDPHITRVRSDLKWEEVLKDFLDERPQQKQLTGNIIIFFLLKKKSSL